MRQRQRVVLGRIRGQAAEGPVPSIDSLPPSCLTLNRRGERGGKNWDWLMPNVMGFLENATLFADTRSHLPAATDMNYLNAVAGTSSAQTGVVSVSLQPWNWNPDGTMRIEPIHVSWFRDEQGRPVDTLFNAWKRKWPNSKTIRSLTLPIVTAIRGPGVAAGKVISDPAYARNHRISDLAVTFAQMYGLTLRTTTVGQDRTADLV